MCSVMPHSLQPHGLYVACQAPLSMESSRQEYWSGLPFPFPGDLSDPGIEPDLLHHRQILYHLRPREAQVSAVKHCELAVNIYVYIPTSLVAQMVENLPVVWETWVQSLGWKIPWRRAWQPTAAFLPGESPRTEEPVAL